VLGPGCANCQNLEKAVRGALAGLGRLGLEATVEKVTDYGVIAGYGVMSTPALVVDEKVVLAGRVPTVAQVRDLLMAAAPPGRTEHCSGRGGPRPIQGVRPTTLVPFCA
jgi:small redox-active disulfide protein 2